MTLRYFSIILGLLICLHRFPVDGFPQLRNLYGSNSDARIKKGEVSSSSQHSDEDVFELEHLKNKPIFENSNTDGEIAEKITTHHHDIDSNVKPSIDNAFEDPIISEDALPALQKQLEATAAKINVERVDDDIESTNLSGQLEREEEIIVRHRPTEIPGTILNGQQNNQDQSNHEMNEKSPPAKSFYGAARLAFGQNPEVLPTIATTTTTTPATTFVTSNSAPAAIITNDDAVIMIPSENASSSSIALSDVISKENDDVNEEEKLAGENLHDSHNSKHEIEDPIVAELEATKANIERRSLDRIPPKTAESLLKHAESSFDMAQYVFWTGDEAGVARAVEEFIQQGLMSRENALKFLREIRMGIDYLQKSYDNRVFPERKANNYKKSDPKTNLQLSTTISEQLNQKTLPQIQSHSQKDEREKQQINLNIQKTVDDIPSLNKLRELCDNFERKGIDNINNDEDDIAGRIRIADFIYTEYTLEEVIYQLAKVMFSQSLIHGSEQSQKALQRLTGFLETAGQLGQISPPLQKKILDVLLAALSDTLANHPELLSAARANLGKTFHQFQHNSLDSMKH